MCRAMVRCRAMCRLSQEDHDAGFQMLIVRLVPGCGAELPISAIDRCHRHRLIIMPQSHTE